MKKYLLLSLFAFFISNSSFSQTVENLNIYFNSDEYALDVSTKLNLQAFLDEIAIYNESSLQITGHTDQDGATGYNLELSKMRAEMVKQYFIKNGILPTDIVIRYLGESDLAKDGLDAESKRENRRVSIVAEGYEYTNVTEIVDQLVSRECIDKRIIDQNNKSNINLTKGTEVKIPVNAFCHLDGSPLKSDKVELSFKEAFEYLDMVDNRLFTQTDDQLLETGGMIHIEASQNGIPLKLKDGKQIELLFPEQEQKDGMELFTGKIDEDGIIWEETGEEITSLKGKSDAPFIQVDLSPLLDYEFKDMGIPSIDLTPMTEYPHPARISYPPYKENYSEEGYAKAVKKYDRVMDAREKDKITRPARLKEWIVKAEERKSILFEHKRNYVISKAYNKLKSNIIRLKKDQDRISHDRLVDVLFSFLNSEIGEVPYDEWHYVKKTYGGTVVDVREEIGLTFPRYDKMMAGGFFLGFLDALELVKGRIAAKKGELGYVDKDVLSRYVVKTSNLGWINCDRFIRLSANEKMNLEFASTSDENQYYLIFKDIRSLIRPYKSGGMVSFKGVPKGEDVRLVAVHMKDGAAQLAINDFTLGTKDGVKLSFAHAEIKDLKRALEEI